MANPTRNGGFCDQTSIQDVVEVMGFVLWYTSVVVQPHGLRFVRIDMVIFVCLWSMTLIHRVEPPGVSIGRVVATLNVRLLARCCFMLCRHDGESSEGRCQEMARYEVI
jgi:hypothetical protein